MYLLVKFLLLLSLSLSSFSKDLDPEVKFITLGPDLSLEDLHQRLGGDYGVGNGGNSNFLLIAPVLNELLEFLEENQELFPEFSFSEFKETVSKTEIYFVRGVNSSEELFEAINFSSGEAIFIDLIKWKSINEKRQKGLLLHEYLSVMGLEKDNYLISSRINLGNKLERYIKSYIKENKLHYSVSKVDCIIEGELTGFCKVYDLEDRQFKYVIVENGSIVREHVR